MKIAIYGNKYHESKVCIHHLMEELEKHQAEVSIYKPLYETALDKHRFNGSISTVFSNHQEMEEDIDFLISLGGDGTFLETLQLIRDKQTPIAGINTGKLGFLANIAKDRSKEAIQKILNNQYTLEERQLIQLKEANHIFGDFPYALNEITLQKKDSTMITVQVHQEDELINSYWADGLIISTPTGSTAYSLSVGGPIAVPGTRNFIISPIAPHNLTVRPLIIPDNKELTVSVSARSKEYLITADSRTETAPVTHPLKIKAAPFNLNMIRLADESFYDTLRRKLMWGADIRN